MTSMRESTALPFPQCLTITVSVSVRPPRLHRAKKIDGKLAANSGQGGAGLSYERACASVVESKQITVRPGVKRTPSIPPCVG